MTTFITVPVECPHCSNQMYDFELTSYFAPRSRVYSDGKVEYSNLKIDQEILICTACHKSLWRDEVVGDDRDVNLDGIANVMTVDDLYFVYEEDYEKNVFAYYLNLLQNGFANTHEKEMYIRMKMWHFYNDKYRALSTGASRFVKRNIKSVFSFIGKKVQKKEKRTGFFETNLRRLMVLFQAETDGERMLLAEMHRELKEFDEALSILESLQGIENQHLLRAMILAARRKEYQVISV